MDRFKVFVGVALLFSLLSNLMLFSKIENLESTIGNISSNQSQILSAVHSQTGSVTNAVNQMKEEQSRFGPISFKLADFKKDEGLLKFSWQLKEFGQNTEVVLNYRIGDSAEFTTVEAKGKNGFYEAEVWSPVVVEPEWQIALGWSNRQQNEKPIRAKEAEEKEKILGFEKSKIEYFVSVKEQGITKSSNLNTSHLGNIGNEKYLPIQVHLFIDNKVFGLNVVEFLQHNEGQLKFKEVYLRKYANNTLVTEKKLNKDRASSDGEIQHYVSPQNDLTDCDYLVVKVVYENGDMFEKEVYRK